MIPQTNGLRELLMQELHETAIAAHLGDEDLHMHYSKRLGGLNYANGQHALFSSVQYVLESRILQQSHLVCCNPCQSQKDISQVMALTL